MVGGWCGGVCGGGSELVESEQQSQGAFPSRPARLYTAYVWAMLGNAWNTSKGGSAGLSVRREERVAEEQRSYGGDVVGTRAHFEHLVRGVAHLEDEEEYERGREAKGEWREEEV